MQSDLISRKNLLEILEKKRAWALKHGEVSFASAIWDDMNTIKRVDAVDAVPVVRCKECKHHRNGACPMRTLHVAQYGYKINDNTTDNGFCHMGEKTDGGDNA